MASLSENDFSYYFMYILSAGIWLYDYIYLQNWLDYIAFDLGMKVPL